MVGRFHREDMGRIVHYLCTNRLLLPPNREDPKRRRSNRGQRVSPTHSDSNNTVSKHHQLEDYFPSRRGMLMRVALSQGVSTGRRTPCRLPYCLRMQPQLGTANGGPEWMENSTAARLTDLLLLDRLGSGNAVSVLTLLALYADREGLMHALEVYRLQHSDTFHLGFERWQTHAVFGGLVDTLIGRLTTTPPPHVVPLDLDQAMYIVCLSAFAGTRSPSLPAGVEGSPTATTFRA